MVVGGDGYPGCVSINNKDDNDDNDNDNDDNNNNHNHNDNDNDDNDNDNDNNGNNSDNDSDNDNDNNNNDTNISNNHNTSNFWFATINVHAKHTSLELNTAVARKNHRGGACIHVTSSATGLGRCTNHP